MMYISTRDKQRKVSAAEAIVAGLAPDGGLFFPETLPQISTEELSVMASMDYVGRATEILCRFLEGFSKEELHGLVSKAYDAAKFPASVAPLISPESGSALWGHTHILELFHGPTCAFKDFALQLLPLLLTTSIKKTGVDKTVVILVATSGDTGKAALEGFANVPGTKICVFYPQGGTSHMQRRQMTTQSGENVMVFSAKGNFDQAQDGVKRIFSDQAFANRLAEQEFMLSSANSINWGRLVPQIAYYFSAYCDLVNKGNISMGDAINFTVPTGNFGNILAASLARRCGLPVHKLICASNRNHVLTDFLTTGVYDRNRDFHLTASPSMDILVSSNLERLLYLNGGDQATRDYMESLSQQGAYSVSPTILEALQKEFACGWANDEETDGTIRSVWQETGYLCDPHTAVAVKVYRDYVRQSGDHTPNVIVSTASPFKFAGNVLPAAFEEMPSGDDFQQLGRLEVLSGLVAPAPLMDLQNLKERFQTVISPDEMKQAVGEWLGLEVL